MRVFICFILSLEVEVSEILFLLGYTISNGTRFSQIVYCYVCVTDWRMLAGLYLGLKSLK